MQRGIIIATSKATKDFLKPLLDSIKTNYPIIVVGNDGYDGEYVNIVNEQNEFECGAIRYGLQFDEFIFLMDTMLVKDSSFIDDVFNTEGSIFFMEHFRSYIGKYVSKYIEGIPEVRNKRQAVEAEVGWLQQYKQRSNAKPYKQLLPHATNKMIEIFGDQRCVIENDYLIKYKKYFGTRSLDS
jgi:hypothetical protein